MSIHRHEGDERGKSVGVNEVRALTGLTKRAIHYYEERAYLGVVARRSDGRRVYSDEQVTRLRKIAALVQAGLRGEEAAAIASAAPGSPAPVTAKRLVELITRAVTEHQRGGEATRLLVEALLLRTGNAP